MRIYTIWRWPQLIDERKKMFFLSAYVYVMCVLLISFECTLHHAHSHRLSNERIYHTYRFYGVVEPTTLCRLFGTHSKSQRKKNHINFEIASICTSPLKSHSKRMYTKWILFALGDRKTLGKTLVNNQINT